MTGARITGNDIIARLSSVEALMQQEMMSDVPVALSYRLLKEGVQVEARATVIDDRGPVEGWAQDIIPYRDILTAPDDPVARRTADCAGKARLRAAERFGKHTPKET